MARKYALTLKHIHQKLSPPQRLLFFKKPWKRGKGRKKGKAEIRERQNLSKYFK